MARQTRKILFANDDPWQRRRKLDLLSLGVLGLILIIGGVTLLMILVSNGHLGGGPSPAKLHDVTRRR